VTGVSSGLGLATANRFSRERAIVFITGRRQAELDAAALDIGRGAKTIRGDIASPADLDRIHSQVAAAERRIDYEYSKISSAQKLVHSQSLKGSTHRCRRRPERRE
jgi:NAD(P)-dependent dehydrogenase (short-subunit alcohol dehydrogenase family)